MTITDTLEFYKEKMHKKEAPPKKEAPTKAAPPD
jgi:hypothetical protein|tara:strand:+ start:545 stop:646 length:102 start_codon:yes stop_codon:yes gene_type:complete